MLFSFNLFRRHSAFLFPFSYPSFVHFSLFSFFIFPVLKEIIIWSSFLNSSWFLSAFPSHYPPTLSTFLYPTVNSFFVSFPSSTPEEKEETLTWESEQKYKPIRMRKHMHTYKHFRARFCNCLSRW